MWTNELTLAEQLTQACRDHDQLMQEHRAAQAGQLVRKVFEPPPPPEPEPPAPPPAPTAPWRSDDVLLDGVADGVMMIIAEERKRADNARAEMEREIGRLQGQIDALMTLLRPDAKTQKSGEDDLPRLTWRN